MTSETRLDITTRLILILLMVVVFLKTLSPREAARFKKMATEILKRIDENLSSADEKSSSSDEENSSGLRLGEELRKYIVSNVKNRNYSRVKRRLEKLGYTNVRIRKRMNLIILECDQGKDVIVLND